MNIRLVTGIAATAALLVLAPANAATLIYDSNATTVTAIADLDVSGTLYNVDFDVSGAYQTFGGDQLFWEGNNTGALAGAQAIVSALNAGIPTPASVGSAVSGSSSFSVLASATGSIVGTQYTGAISSNFGFGWSNPNNVGPIFGPFSTAWSEAAVVPIPAAAWLFGSALGLLGWVRRRTA